MHSGRRQLTDEEDRALAEPARGYELLHFPFGSFMKRQTSWRERALAAAITAPRLVQAHPSFRPMVGCPWLIRSNSECAPFSEERCWRPIAS